MSIRQMLHTIKVGIRSRLFVCVLLVMAAYCFVWSRDPHVRLASILVVMVASEAMIMLWGTSFVRMLSMSFVRKGQISWQEIPEFNKFRALAESQHIKLNKKRPFGVQKDLDNAYANPLTKQIVVGDLLLQKLDDGLLTALMGHEISHIKRKHQIKMLIWTTVAPIIVIIPLFGRVSSAVCQLTFYAVFFVVFLLMSWHNEYDADSGAAEIAGVDNTIGLLRKIVPKRQQWHESETHPSIHSRILKLQRLHLSVLSDKLKPNG